MLEYAALVHDTGHLPLVDRVPAGAAVVPAAAEQRRVAPLSCAVVRRTRADCGVPSSCRGRPVTANSP